MYRPYTTIGTNKQVYIKRFLTVFWVLAVIVSRGVFFFYGRRDVAPDLYGLFARSVIRLEEGDPCLDSGLAYAYTRSLSRLLKFAGNQIEAVHFYQMVLQILWLILLFAGISLLFGYGAGVVAGSILTASPWVIGTVFIVWPGNYYMLHFSFVFVLLGYFGHRARNKGWFSNDWGRWALIVTGFYVGVLCIWNILGFLLALVMIYILIRNSIYKKKLNEETNQEPRVMGTGTQAIVLVEGILVGVFATLMKYTGVTGEAIVGQAIWWLSQLRAPFAPYSEFQILLLFLWLLNAAVAGILCQLLYHIIQKKRKPLTVDGGAEEYTMAGYGMETKKEMAVQGEPGRYIITEDGRRIKLLDNPLPGPKKHVRKEMDFDRDFEDVAKVEVQDDFDIEIKDDDDFDIE